MCFYLQKHLRENKIVFFSPPNIVTSPLLNICEPASLNVCEGVVRKEALRQQEKDFMSMY